MMESSNNSIYNTKNINMLQNNAKENLIQNDSTSSSNVIFSCEKCQKTPLIIPSNNTK